ncbi:MAG: 50S ribosomal protein L9 [Spirochaetales bacterium]|jgi:large subunit ribosomal protein L9|nr:50S ribosomal protein L9 [Spirochaetales bacterium]
MKIILNKDVYNLGEEGDICEVANGYGRNYLLPKKLAVSYKNANLALFKSRSSAIEKRKTEKRSAAMSQKEKLDGLKLTIKASAGDSGKLFGAVTATTIVEALAKEGLTLDRKKIDVPSHTIKMVGDYQVLIKLYEKESATVNVSVIDERSAKKEQVRVEKETAKSSAGQEAMPWEEEEAAEEAALEAEDELELANEKKSEEAALDPAEKEQEEKKTEE